MFFINYVKQGYLFMQYKLMTSTSPTFVPKPALGSLGLLFNFLRNMLAFLGLATVGGGIILYGYGQQATRLFDDQFILLFSQFVEQVLRKDVASAMIVRTALEKGVTIEQAIKSIKLYANQLNLKFIAHYPLHKEIQSVTGKKARFIEIFEFCDAKVASLLLEHNPDFAGHLPYRIVLYEESQGQLWLATLNMELLLHGSQNLNSESKKQALKIQDNLLKIMGAGASGAL